MSEYVLVILLSPIPELQHPPLPLKMLRARELALTPNFFVVKKTTSYVNDCIAQSKLILQRGFVVEIGVHKSKASNSLKLNYKINNEIVGCLLNLNVTNSFIIL